MKFEYLETMHNLFTSGLSSFMNSLKSLFSISTISKGEATSSNSLSTAPLPKSLPECKTTDQRLNYLLSRR